MGSAALRSASSPLVQMSSLAAALNDADLTGVLQVLKEHFQNRVFSWKKWKMNALLH